MPTYEYKCKVCGHRFEEFQKMSDEPLRECPKCSCEVERLIHGGSGVIFKGGGWYVTEYGKGKSSASVGAKGSEPSDSKADEKPEEKPPKEKDKPAVKED
ncbi:MAG TPA: zinc ribbon domain-containing protein [candidate division Zixibacteria bacterium]|nr:zinc ribbon domain-containing protein [candidate division Zixibacteria bacterium]